MQTESGSFYRRTARPALALMLACALVACGQKGPLQRPDAPVPVTSSVTLNAVEAAAGMQL